jgi:hypothetical protein
MRGDCSFAGGARTVAIERLAAAPASQSHEIAFAAAAGKPTVGERVPQLMRVEPVAEPGLASSRPA